MKRRLGSVVQGQSDISGMAQRGGGHLVLGVVAAVAGDPIAAAPPGAHVGELWKRVHLHPPALQSRSLYQQQQATPACLTPLPRCPGRHVHDGAMQR